MDAAPYVRLKLSGRAENVLLVRQALSGLAEAMGLDAVDLNDLSTAVTEAANNVVLHAYGDGEGPLEVEFVGAPAGLDVLVGDRGSGIQPAVHAGESLSDGIGLPVIQTLADSVEFRDRPTGGTEVAMHFELSQTLALERGPGLEGAGLEAFIGEDGPETVVLAVAPAAVARSVIPRVLSTLAARAYFSTDRIADTQLLADTLVAELGGASGGQLLLGASVAPRSLELRIGPLAGGLARTLVAGGGPMGLSSVIARLTDGPTFSDSGSLELLDLHLAQRD
jgi:serine/threonine-protein kinase RsbW